MTGTMLTESSRLMRGAKLNPPIYLPKLRSEQFRMESVGGGVLHTLRCFRGGKIIFFANKGGNTVFRPLMSRGDFLLFRNK